MSHDRDRDHPPPHPAEVPPKPPHLGSNPKPDRKRVEHPTPLPAEPVDPRSHPSRGLRTREARPA